VSRWADTIVIALDNDEAGICAAERVARDCPRPRKGITFLRYEHTNAKDIGDMTNDEIEGAITGTSPIPWWL
jgi:DNA primase